MDLIRAGTCSSAHTGPALPSPPPRAAALSRAPSGARSHFQDVLSSLQAQPFALAWLREGTRGFFRLICLKARHRYSEAPVLLGHRAGETFPARSKGGFAAALPRASWSICKWSESRPNCSQMIAPRGSEPSLAPGSALPRRWGSAGAVWAQALLWDWGYWCWKGGPPWLCWGSQAVFSHFAPLGFFGV